MWIRVALRTISLLNHLFYYFASITPLPQLPLSLRLILHMSVGGNLTPTPGSAWRWDGGVLRRKSTHNNSTLNSILIRQKSLKRASGGEGDQDRSSG